jgi:hypothetical protein
MLLMAEQSMPQCVLHHPLTFQNLNTFSVFQINQDEDTLSMACQLTCAILLPISQYAYKMCSSVRAIFSSAALELQLLGNCAEHSQPVIFQMFSRIWEE